MSKELISAIGCNSRPRPLAFSKGAGIDCRRDYSQAIDVGTLAKGLDVATIRLLVWVFGFLSFGYATAEFEVLLRIPPR
jgi:hypothetical protein